MTASSAPTPIAVAIVAQDRATQVVKAFRKTLGDTASAAERSGARVSRFMDTSGLARQATALGVVDRSANGAANGVMRLLPALAGVGSAGLIAGIDRMAASWAAATMQMGNQARTLGMPVAHLDALGHAADMAGSSHEALGQGLSTLQKSMYDARFGLNPLMASLEQKLHIDPDAGPEAAFRRIMQAAHDAAGPMQRMTILTAAFGGAAQDLEPIARRGLAVLDNYTDTAARLGTQTDKDVARAEAMSLSWKTMGVAATEAQNAIFTALSPTVTFLNGEVTAAIGNVHAKLDAWAQTDGPERLAGKVKSSVDEIEGLAKDHPYLAAMLGIGGARMLPGLAALGLRMVPGLGLVATGVGAANYAVGDIPVNEKSRSEYGEIGKFFYDNNPAIRWADTQIRRQHDKLSYDNNNAQYIDQLKSLGWTDAGAIGSIANAQVESGFNTRAQNGSHVGLFQWDASRTARIEAQFHKRIQDMSAAEQISAFDWEARKYYSGAVAAANKIGNSAGQAGGVISRDFEVPNPADPMPEMLRRGALADAIAKRYQAAAYARQVGGSIAGQFHLGVDPNAPNPYAYGPYQETAEEPDLSRGTRPEEPDLSLGGRVQLSPEAQAGGRVVTETTIHLSHDAPPRATSTSKASGNVSADKPRVAQSGMTRGF